MAMISRHLRVDPTSQLPIVAQLANQVTWLIARRELSEGEMLPPIRALADELGINFNTVRAAYKQLEANGLVTTQRGRGTTVLGYERRHHAATSRVRSFTIGVIVPTHNAFYVPFLNALETASTDPSLLFVCVAQENPLKGLHYVDQLVAKDVDGIIIAGAMVPRNTPLPRYPPIVFADYPNAPGPAVVINHEEGIAVATQHLLEHGHTRLGFVAPPRDLPNVAPKYTGFERALQTKVEPKPVGLIEATPDFTLESGYRSATQLLTRADPPTGIVAASDTLALGAVEAARELNVAIPHDVALVSSDDMTMSRYLNPPLTSVHVPPAHLGTETMVMIQALIAHKPLAPNRLILNTQLVVRQSCGHHP